MFRPWYKSFSLIFLFLIGLPFQMALGSSEPLSNGDQSQEQQFPFDKPCLTFNKADFKSGEALLEVMKTGDFPQYCVVYPLSGYKVKQVMDGGYLLTNGADDTVVFLKSDKKYPANQPLAAKEAYFVGPERFVVGNGVEQEFYVFQEIDF